MMTDCPRYSLSFGAINLAEVSEPPPAENPIMRRIGLLGYSDEDCENDDELKQKLISAKKSTLRSLACIVLSSIIV